MASECDASTNQIRCQLLIAFSLFSPLQFDVCVSKLPRLESNLNQILNINMNGDKTDGGYSFFCVDPEWDTMQRGGPWSNIDLNSIEYVRSDLQSNPKLHSITVR